MIKGKTTQGFEYTLDEERLDDFELLEKLACTPENDVKTIIETVKEMIGVEQYQRAKEFLRNEKGKVSFSDMSNLINEIFSLVGVQNETVKNS